MKKQIQLLNLLLSASMILNAAGSLSLSVYAEGSDIPVLTESNSSENDQRDPNSNPAEQTEEIILEDDELNFSEKENESFVEEDNKNKKDNTNQSAESTKEENSDDLILETESADSSFENKNELELMENPEHSEVKHENESHAENPENSDNSEEGTDTSLSLQNKAESDTADSANAGKEAEKTDELAWDTDSEKSEKSQESNSDDMDPSLLDEEMLLNYGAKNQSDNGTQYSSVSRFEHGAVKSISGAQKTNNLSDHDYDYYWATVTNSYLYESGDSEFTRVEYVSGNSPYVLVETFQGKYDQSEFMSDYSKKTSLTIKDILPLFGGFYHGTSKNYIVSGQKNPNASKTQTVLQIDQYSHDWKKEKTLNIPNINTYTPFDAGSCRFAETGNSLYIYTCHTMDKTSDGYNHQANMIFEIDKSTFKVKQSYTDIMNIHQAGYVSHSFNQFIQTDGTSVFRVDHGDASPRAISIVKSAVNGKITTVNYTLAYPIAESSGHYNETGVSIGGMELSDDKILIAGNSIDMAEKGRQRNIMVLITDKNLQNTETVWLTDYEETDKVEIGNPYLVKMSNDSFMVLWEETDSSQNTITKARYLQPETENYDKYVYSFNTRLSDCKPVYCSDEMIRWYTTDSSTLKLTSLNSFLTYNRSFTADNPPVPENASIQLTIDGSVQLKWKAEADYQYSIWRKTPSESEFNFLCGTNYGESSYIDPNVSEGEYQYQVRALRIIAGYIYSSDPAESKISIQPYTLYAAPKSGVTMNLSWPKAGANTGGYELYYSSNGSDYKKIKTLGASQTSTSHTGLSAGTLYLYKLAVLDKNGNIVQISKVADAVALAPAEVYSTGSTLSGNVIAWSQASGSERYNVYRSTSENGTYTYLDSVVSAYNRVYYDSTAEPGKTYYYKVRPYKRVNGKVYYTAWSAPAKIEPLKEIESFTVTPKSGVTMSLSWDKVENAYMYNVYTGTKVMTKVKSTGASQTSASHTGLSAGTLYTYQVEAVDKNGTVLAVSQTKSAVALAPAKIESTNSGLSGNEINWSRASGSDRYNIYRSTSENGTYEYLESLVGADNRYYLDKTAKPGVTYYYKVRPYKRVDGIVYYAAWADAVKVYTIKNMGLTVVPKSGVTMSLSWDKVPNAYSYEIYSQTGPWTAGVIKTASASQTSASITNLSAGNLYWYFIQALDKNGAVLASSQTKMAVALAPAKIESVKQGSNGVTLTWSKASGSDRYNVYRSTSKNGTYEYLESMVGADNRTYVDKNVEKGKTYYYKVRPYKRVDGVVYYANWDEAKSITVK